jgi:hypothetical protein
MKNANNNKKNYHTHHLTHKDLNAIAPDKCMFYKTRQEAVIEQEMHGGIITKIMNYRAQDLEAQYGEPLKKPVGAIKTPHEFLGIKIAEGAKKYVEGYLLQKPAAFIWR